VVGPALEPGAAVFLLPQKLRGDGSGDTGKGEGKVRALKKGDGEDDELRGRRGNRVTAGRTQGAAQVAGFGEGSCLCDDCHLDSRI